MEVILFPLAAWSPDDDARSFAADVRDAIDATVTRKVATDLMRLTSEAQLSEQLSCAKPLNVFRLTALPDAFWDALLERQAARRGGVYLPPGVVVLLKGAAMLGWRRTLRMTLPEKKERVS